ncbi:MAG: RHS repeat-associated core domain-containing protein [Anaerolineae bacterium]|nr:RHS repeat-associated core domain-containing protein [Anaerolineae bacterium]
MSYLFGDHLGSTSVTADATGVRTGELWYKPWGENRGTPYQTTPTQRRFTGQVLDEVAGGLYFYNARYYDPVGAQPTPNLQSLNRYAYAANNPLRFSDPGMGGGVSGSWCVANRLISIGHPFLRRCSSFIRSCSLTQREVLFHSWRTSTLNAWDVEFLQLPAHHQ